MGMFNFKIGDKVRRVGTNFAIAETGKVYTVSETCGQSVIYLVEDNSTVSYSSEEFVLADSDEPIKSVDEQIAELWAKIQRLEDERESAFLDKEVNVTFTTKELMAIAIIVGFTSEVDYASYLSDQMTIKQEFVKHVQMQDTYNMYTKVKGMLPSKVVRFE